MGGHLSAFLESAGFAVVRVSRRDIPGQHRVADYSQTPNADLLVHLAEEPDRGRVNRLGEAAAREATDLVDKLSRRFPRSMIYASSAAVYGDEHELPCSVDMALQAHDLYSAAKLRNEQIVLAAGGSVARLSNLFGSGMGQNNVLADIMRQIPGSGPLRVQDDTPVRDFLPVSEAVRAFAALAETGYSGVVNVGSGLGTSVRTLARLALVASGEEQRHIVATARSSRRSVNILEISHTKRALSWAPSFSLVEELGLLIAARTNAAHE